MRTQDIEYRADSVRMVGQYAVDDGSSARRPGVLVIHEGPGLTEHTRKIAARLAGMGYAAFAMDYHGEGKPHPNLAEVRPQIAAWIANPTGIMARATSALDVLKAQKEVDTGRLAAIGYCFGGSTALEMARSGAALGAVVSFHGTLASPRPQDAANIKARVLVCHGGADPLVPPAQVAEFVAAMAKAPVDWQLHSYSGVVHGFTNPEADQAGTPALAYDKAADRRSWQAMLALFGEAFGPV